VAHPKAAEFQIRAGSCGLGNCPAPHRLDEEAERLGQPGAIRRIEDPHVVEYPARKMRARGHHQPPAQPRLRRARARRQRDRLALEWLAAAVVAGHFRPLRAAIGAELHHAIHAGRGGRGGVGIIRVEEPARREGQNRALHPGEIEHGRCERIDPRRRARRWAGRPRPEARGAMPPARPGDCACQAEEPIQIRLESESFGRGGGKILDGARLHETQVARAIHRPRRHVIGGRGSRPMR
jgi:hypothetical protein